eukprot:scaffold77941_cov22-Tisochrysis_lutea.AAC.1
MFDPHDRDAGNHRLYFKPEWRVPKSCECVASYVLLYEGPVGEREGERAEERWLEVRFFPIKEREDKIARVL